MLPWIALVLCVAVLLAAGVNWLLKRLGLEPEPGSGARSGLANLAERLERWSETQRRPPRDGRR